MVSMCVKKKKNSSPGSCSTTQTAESEVAVGDQ